MPTLEDYMEENELNIFVALGRVEADIEQGALEGATLETLDCIFTVAAVIRATLWEMIESKQPQAEAA